MTFNRLEADAAEPHSDTRTGWDDGSFARTERQGWNDRERTRVELFSDVTGHRFRVRCTRCALPMRWFNTRAEAQAQADAHLAFMHAGEFPMGRWVPPRLRPGEWRVESRTRPGVFYRVTQGIDGARVCTCAASEYGLDCWHLRAPAA